MLLQAISDKWGLINMSFVKKISSMILALALLVAIPTTVLANDINVYIAGHPVQFTDQRPVIVDGRVLVPIRDVFEAMAFDVVWRPTTEEVYLTGYQGWVEIVVPLHSPEFQTIRDGNAGVMHDLDVPAQIINGRTMLPLRAIMESIGWEVYWNEGTRTVHLETIRY